MTQRLGQAPCRSITCTNRRSSASLFCRDCWRALTPEIRNRIRRGRNRAVKLAAFREALEFLRGLGEGT